MKTLFIVGPTASGKSALAMQLAEELGGEIICADSQTIRRELNIGTAKPSLADQKKVPHHLLDIIDPYDEYSAAQFKAAAETALADIHSGGKIAVVVGGTGLYVDALFYDYKFEASPGLTSIRSDLMKRTVGELQTEIKAKGYVMPLNDKNPRHLIRTLESGGMKALDRTPRPDSMIIGLNPGREIVKQHIAERLAYIFEHGFMDEVQALVKKHGYPTRQLDAIAYRIAAEYLDTRDSANYSAIKEAIGTAESQFAKRQITWFKRNPHIKWFKDAESARHDVLSLLQ